MRHRAAWTVSCSLMSEASRGPTVRRECSKFWRTKYEPAVCSTMRAERLDLAHDPVSDSRYHLIAANMVLHHVDRVESLLTAFHQMLLPGGFVAIADLDTEPGLFHGPEVAESVYHHGFDRRALMDRLYQMGFIDAKDVTAHVIRKPIAGGDSHDFPVFLIVGRRAWSDRASLQDCPKKGE